MDNLLITFFNHSKHRSVIDKKNTFQKHISKHRSNQYNWKLIYFCPQVINTYPQVINNVLKVNSIDPIDIMRIFYMSYPQFTPSLIIIILYIYY